MLVLSRTKAQGVKKFQCIAIKQSNPTCVRVIIHIPFAGRIFQQGIDTLLFIVGYQRADDIESSVTSPSEEVSEGSRY